VVRRDAVHRIVPHPVPLQVSLEMMSVTIGQALDSARITDKNQLKPKRGSVSIAELVSKCDKVWEIVTVSVTETVPVTILYYCAMGLWYYDSMVQFYVLLMLRHRVA